MERHSYLYQRDDRKFSTTLRLRSYACQICSARRPLPTDPCQLQARNAQFEKILINLLGGIPENCHSINSVTVFDTDLGDCICERIYVDSEATVTIPVLLYRPKQSGDIRKPTIILVHGWNQNKEFAPDVKAKLVRSGYIVVAYDTISHGERRIVADTFDDTQNAIGYALALGKPFFGLTTWDLMHLIDYLQSRPDVDPTRIAAIGLCMGAQQLWFAGAIDKRLKVIVLVCGTSTYESMVQEMASYHTHCLFTYLPGILQKGDTQDILALIAPRPLLIMNNYNDIWFPVSGYKKVCDELEMVYHTLGASDRFRHIIRNTVHAITPEFTDEALEWLDRWL